MSSQYNGFCVSAALYNHVSGNSLKCTTSNKDVFLSLTKYLFLVNVHEEVREKRPTRRESRRSHRHIISADSTAFALSAMMHTSDCSADR